MLVGVLPSKGVETLFPRCWILNCPVLSCTDVASSLAILNREMKVKMQAEQDQLCKEINWQNYTSILDLGRKRTFTLPWTFYKTEIAKEFSNAHPPYLHEKGEEEP